MAQPVLLIDGLTKSFKAGPFSPAREVLRGIDLVVEAGQVFGFFGINGAGKSTTNKIVLGFLPQDRGNCRILGRSNLEPASRQRIGYLPENPSYYEFLTGEELLLFAADLFGLAGEKSRTRIRYLLERVGLANDGSRRIGQYSKGMRQRIGLAQALINEPTFLMLDEPMEGLDPLGRQMLKELILEERSRGTAVFLCSHQLLDAEGLCDTIAILHDGRVTLAGTMAQVRALHPDLDLEQIFIRTVRTSDPAANARPGPSS
ncbi:MAG: ABC transporter ATP-binding protein [Candidatus Riflebacteria bacterium]|nr:ABC transporter ATP-binding protein [Candidatus Riflebacteria bacterium]